MLNVEDFSVEILLSPREPILTKEEELNEYNPKTLFEKEEKESFNLDTERYIIDNAILLAPVEYDNELPVALKILYLTTLKWNAFHSNQKYGENILKAIEWTLQVSIFYLNIRKIYLILILPPIGFM